VGDSLNGLPPFFVFFLLARPTVKNGSIADSPENRDSKQKCRSARVFAQPKPAAANENNISPEI
jgi:hypothetical protein